MLGNIGLIAILGCLVSSPIIAVTKEWNNIRPLHTTRREVEKILGKPVETNDRGCSAIFEKGDERIEVYYLCFSCDKGKKENKKKRIDVVLRVLRNFRNRPALSDLGFDLSKFTKAEGHIKGDIAYNNKREGIAIFTDGDKVRMITYYAAESDMYLDCVK
jgi:hypothetical protein